jgi:hypothetical protein
MFHYLNKVLSAVVFSVILTGCATSSPPVIKTLLVQPEVPLQLLSCDREPLVPDHLTYDVELAQYLEAVRLAGEDCRSHIAAIQQYLEEMKHM